MNASLSSALVALLVGGASLVGGCVDNTAGSPTPSPDAGAPVPAPDAGTTPEAACPALASAPTLHHGDLAGDETWTAAASPHVLDATVTIRAGHTLTIEPCAVVRLSERASLEVAFPGTPNRGALVAVGTAARPIVFEGKDGARWSRLHVQAPGTARLAHVTLRGGGGDGALASLVAEGTGVTPAAPAVALDHVTVEGSASLGVKLLRAATFAPGSADLVVRGAATAPLGISEHALGAIPTGSYTGNAVDEIRIDPEDALAEDATLRALGVPYHVGDSRGDGLRIGKGTGAALATLTVEPGTTVRFEPGAALEIEHLTGELPASGALVAVGTAERPIVFTSAKPTPAAGDWRGLWFGGQPRAENRVAHVRLEYTGADCGCVLSSCSALTFHEGAVIFSQPPPSAFITDTTVAHGSGHGFVLGYVGARVDFVSGNTFEDVAGCKATLPSQASCPSPKPACE